MRKTKGYILEKYMGKILFPLLLVYFFFLIEPSYCEWKAVFEEMPTVSFSIFGFLLTLITIILQGNSETIVWMRKREKLFNRLVNFNKKVVFLSFFVGVFSLLIKLLDNLCVNDYVRIFLTSTLLSLCILLLPYVIYFLIIFYLLIQK